MKTGAITVDLDDSAWTVVRRRPAVPAGPWEVVGADTTPTPDEVNRLAALIRKVDGAHDLGAAALAEALIEHGVRASSSAGEDPLSRLYRPLEKATTADVTDHSRVSGR